MTGKVVVKTKKENFKVLQGQDEDLECIDPNYVHVWSDGGGNCGPASIGIVVVEERIIRQIYGEYLGDHMTNNIAEFTAILRGLQLVKSKRKPVKLYSDSNYALYSISGAFNGGKNRALIDHIVDYVKAYPVEVIFVKVKGHSNLLYNEMADSIATTILQQGNVKKKRRNKKHSKSSSNEH